jgi:hypothetical protein
MSMEITTGAPCLTSDDIEVLTRSVKLRFKGETRLYESCAQLMCQE